MVTTELLQDKVKALVAARNLGDPMQLMPGTDQLDCTQLAAELAERRRNLNLFTSHVRLVEERRGSLLAEIAATEAAKNRRAIELEAAEQRAAIDKAALESCQQGNGMENGECIRQEMFFLRSRSALRDAREALASVTTSLQALQVKDSELGADILSLKADITAIQEESDHIVRIMVQKGCAIPDA
jgi:vacuolar-type H+-ATPase subunit D/Vma8